MFVAQGGLRKFSITCDKALSFLGQTRKKEKITNARFQVDSLLQA